jgi:hypothetical protein
MESVSFVVPSTWPTARRIQVLYALPRPEAYSSEVQQPDRPDRPSSKRGMPSGLPSATTDHDCRSLGVRGSWVQGPGRRPRRSPQASPRITRDHGPQGVWTPTECTQFRDSCIEHRLRAAWVWRFVVRARRGELAGLKWSKVDLDRGVLLVHWQRTTTSAGVVEKEPKGGSEIIDQDFLDGVMASMSRTYRPCRPGLKMTCLRSAFGMKRSQPSRSPPACCAPAREH